MDERLMQIKDLIGQINSIIAEIEGETQMTPEEQKQKEKDSYLNMSQEERDALDKKKLLVEPTGDE